MDTQLLDPLSTMCKLIALNFNCINTKLSIQNHIITLHQPNGYQSLVRLYNGDGRENASGLYYAVVRLIKWYIVSETVDTLNNTVNSNSISGSEEFIKMVHYLCRSFKKLQETYKNGNVILALQFYINLLEDGVAGTFDDRKLPILDDNRMNLIDYNKIKNLWDVAKIKRICALYDHCFEVADADYIPDEEKDAVIGGYLRSINTMLDFTDKEFQKLVLNNDKR